MSWLKDSCKRALHMHLVYYEKKKYGQSIVEFLNDVNLASHHSFLSSKEVNPIFRYHKLTTEKIT